tara:strand:+ start:131 stop:400 length:270 start_codon:yes stop_codon:yes gene_type:complete
MGRLDDAIASITEASLLEPMNPKYYVYRGLTPSLISNRPTIDLTKLYKEIRNGNWEKSKSFLSKIFDDNSRHIKKCLPDYIKKWCECFQ